MSLLCLKSHDDFLNALWNAKALCELALAHPLSYLETLFNFFVELQPQWPCFGSYNHQVLTSLVIPYVWALIFPRPFISWSSHLVRIPVTVLQYLLLFPVEFFTFTDECISPSKIISLMMAGTLMFCWLLLTIISPIIIYVFSAQDMVLTSEKLIILF